MPPPPPSRSTYLRMSTAQLYWRSFNFVNETNGFLFWAVASAAFVYFGGLWIALMAWIAGFAVALAVKVIFNSRRPAAANAAILVTGTSTGIGSTIAKDFAALGYSVFATVRKQADFDALVASAPAADRPRLLPVILDVTDAASVAAAAETVRAVMNEKGLFLQSVVNNAGYSKFATVEGSTGEFMDRIFLTNVFGPVAVCRAFLPLLRAGRGKGNVKPSVVFVSSIVGRVCIPINGAYSATKHALEAITDALRVEIAAQGISVSLVQPGGVVSQFQATATSDRPELSLSGASGDAPVAAEVAVAEDYAAYTARFDALGRTALLSPSSFPSDAVIEAVSVPYPHARYRCTPDAHILLGLRAILPDSLFDGLFKGMFVNKKPYKDAPRVAEAAAVAGKKSE